MAIKYRSRIEIIASILRAIYDGGSQITRTKLMYKTLLSHLQLKEYLELLIGRDLVKYDSIHSRFRITERGIAFLKAWEQIEGMISTVRPIHNRTCDDFA